MRNTLTITVAVCILLPICVEGQTSQEGKVELQYVEGGGGIISESPGRDSGWVMAGSGPLFNYGEPHYLDMDFMKSASWSVDDEGLATASLRLKSAGAKTISVFFSSLHLVGGAKLLICDKGGQEQSAYTGSMLSKVKGELLTQVIAGEELIIKCKGDSSEVKTSVIHISHLVHGTRDLFGLENGLREDDCLVDVACSGGDEWRDQIRSVVMFLREDGNGCTGVLMNNCSNDYTPYVHIANHCFAGYPSDPDNWVFYFNYEKPGCGTGAASLSQSITGAASVASDYSGDFHLLLLNQSPPASYHPYYAGWDNSGDVPTNGAFIGHPLTLEKKIGLFSSVTSASYPEPGFNKPVWYADIDEGGIEGGSSGSPMFDQNKRMVGHVMDGDVGCSGQRQIIGPKFSSNWEGANAANGLKDWLDPLGYECSPCDGRYPELKVKVKMFLQGPFDMGSGLMSADLAAGSYLPLTEPYTGLSYTHEHDGGGETTTAGVLAASGSAAIVDWVVVELRRATAPYDVFATRSALLRRDGVVADVDGSTDGVTFHDMPTSNYRVAVHHRNHLGVMTDGSYDLVVAEVDFSDAGGPALYGTDAAQVTGGVRCLWMGDVTGDGVVKYTGVGNDRDAILLVIGSNPSNTINGYYSEDTDLDGTVRYAVSPDDHTRILNDVLGGLPTATRDEQLP